MYSRIVLTILFVTFFFSSCVKQTTETASSEVININPYESEDSVNLSEIADSIRCIRLQTDSNNIMGKVREIIIMKKYIYAIDVSQQSIFVFDKTGKYVSKLNKRGDGPDEYVFMGPVFIDANEKFIELIDLKGNKSSKLKYSNISFELVGKTPFPNVSCNSCKRMDGYYYFATQQLENIIDERKTNAGLLISDGNKIKKTFFDKDIKTNNSSFSPNIESFTINNSNELFMSLMYDNTFYKIGVKETLPILTVDFGKYGMDNSIGLKPMEEQMKYVKNMSDLASFPVLNAYNSDMMAFSYYFKKEENRMFREEDFRQYLKFKNNDKIYHVKTIKNDITSFPSHVYISSYFFNCAHEVWYENYLIDIIIPNYYFSKSNTDKIFVDGVGEITAYDNPIVIMMKLKKKCNTNKDSGSSSTI
jgi:hypothetical protein